MCNIKNKITIKTIFFIIIFIYNRKFILKASEKKNSKVPERILKKRIYDRYKNIHKELIAKKYTDIGKTYVANNMLEKAAEAFQEAAQSYNKLALYYKQEAERSTKTSLEIFQCIQLAKEAYESAASAYNEQTKCLNALNNNSNIAIQAEKNMVDTYKNIAEMYENILKTYHNLLKKLHQQANLDMDNIVEVSNHIFLTYNYAGLYFKKYTDCWREIEIESERMAKMYKKSGDFYYSGVEFYTEQSEKENNNTFKAQDYLQEVANQCNNAAESYIKQVEILEYLKYISHYRSLHIKAEELMEVCNDIAKSYGKQAKLLKCLGKEEEGREAHNKIEKLYNQKAEEFYNRALKHKTSKTYPQIKKNFKKRKGGKLSWDDQEFLWTHKECAEEYYYSAKYYTKQLKLLFEPKNKEKAEKAEKIYQKILEAYNNAESFYIEEVELHMKEAKFCATSKNYEKAAESYEKLLELYNQKISPDNNINKLEEKKKVEEKVEGNKKKYYEVLIKIIFNKMENIEQYYTKAHKLFPEETNNRINNIKLFPYKTTLPISALGTIMALLKTQKSTLNSIMIACKIPEKSEIIIVLAATTIFTGIHSLINNYLHKKLFNIHEENRKNNNAIKTS